MKVDTQCSVAISSFSEEECSLTQPPNTTATDGTLATDIDTTSVEPTNITEVTIATESDSVQSDNTAAIIGGTVAVIVVLIVTVLTGIIAIVALVLRARRGSMSLKTPEE